tara:strand:- start:780 stop:1790 length:1011 start_codon:yes stop_codon:yes gene_type:complete
MKKSFWSGKNGPMLIAEIGGNHEGNFKYAKKLVKLAIKSGVDVVKLQIYKGDELVSFYESKKRNKHFKKFELSKDQHIHLANICRKQKVIYAASVWDDDSIKWIDKYLKFYKIGSGDLTSFPIIESIIKRKKPIILSTGLSTLKEIKETINFIQLKNKSYKSSEMLSLLQCTSSYPTLDTEVNLNVIKTLKEKTNLTVGYSHHNKGSLALLAAYAIGAEILEFHFTDDRKGKKFRDHKISLNYEETKNLIIDIKKMGKLFGNFDKKPTKSEISSGHVTSFRRAVYSTKFLKSGDRLSNNFLVCLRPNFGLDPRNLKKKLGKKIKKDTLPFQRILLR